MAVVPVISWREKILVWNTKHCSLRFSYFLCHILQESIWEHNMAMKPLLQGVWRWGNVFWSTGPISLKSRSWRRTSRRCLQQQRIYCCSCRTSIHRGLSLYYIYILERERMNLRQCNNLKGLWPELKCGLCEQHLKCQNNHQHDRVVFVFVLFLRCWPSVKCQNNQHDDCGRFTGRRTMNFYFYFIKCCWPSLQAE